jgi:RimJ/RimL family protein N-acetyltransferase
MPSHAFRLRPGDAPRYVQLRQRMLIEQWDDSLPRHEIETITVPAAAATFGEDSSATFGIEAPPDDAAEPGTVRPLIGMAILARHRTRRYAHRTRLFNVYIERDHRGQGYARQLVSAVIEYARTWQGVDYLDLCVNEDAVGAQRLYARLGFVQWGRQEEAITSHGRRLAEIHMTLKL